MKNDINITSTINFWLCRIPDNYWNQLKKMFKKKNMRISSCFYHKINKNDIILIYSKTTIPIGSGFVGFAQIGSSLIKNEENIKIFNDLNMNKVYWDLKNVHVFDDPFTLGQIEKKLKAVESKSKTLPIKNHIMKEYHYVKLAKVMANDVFDILVEQYKEIEHQKELKIESENNIESESESEDDSEYGSGSDSNSSSDNNSNSDSYSNSGSDSDGDSNSDDSGSDSNSDSNSDSDDSESEDEDLEGHIPIIMIPCESFKWTDDKNKSIKNFKKHYISCEECDKTDNNTCSFIHNMSKTKIRYNVVKKENRIRGQINCYHESKIYNLSEKTDNIRNSINIYKIHISGHMYNKCLVVVW
jgi:hypothetical protein